MNSIKSMCCCVPVAFAIEVNIYYRSALKTCFCCAVSTSCCSTAITSCSVNPGMDVTDRITIEILTRIFVIHSTTNKYEK